MELSILRFAYKGVYQYQYEVIKPLARVRSTTYHSLRICVDHLIEHVVRYRYGRDLLICDVNQVNEDGELELIERIDLCSHRRPR
jgi:hypothetical protein